MIGTRKFLFTFDVEDFINPNAVYALQRILQILEKYKLRAIFFITGHMAEKLSNHPKIIDMLRNHEIGFHSSSHSVHPTIPEYADTKSYEKAYEISLQRETSHINPLTGMPEREGGIYVLQDLFNTKIQAFRAPGMCWTPPHLEALKSLGIKYDFSTNLTYSEPVFYKGITFYPFTVIQQWTGTKYEYECLFNSILRNNVTIFDLHPTLLVNQVEWDSIYYKGNPKSISTVPKKPQKEIELLFHNFELLVKRIVFLSKLKLIDTAIDLKSSHMELKIDRREIERCYKTSMRWPVKYFNYDPKHIKRHFYEFFDDLSSNKW